MNCTVTAQSFAAELEAGHLAILEQIELDISGQNVSIVDCKVCGHQHSIELTPDLPARLAYAA